MAEGKTNTKAWDDLYKRITGFGEDDINVKVGIFESKGGDKKHPVILHDTAEQQGKHLELTILEIAAIHEFGSPKAHIPERSFIRSTFATKADELERVTAKLAKGILHGKVTAQQAMGLLGEWGAAAVKKTIVDKQTKGPQPQENRPETIRRKGSSTPLIDTGLLKNSITYVVSPALSGTGAEGGASAHGSPDASGTDSIETSAISRGDSTGGEGE